MGQMFIKMHGLGNDFIILDARTHPLKLEENFIRLLANRRRGVGCDQLLVLEPPSSSQSDAFMRIYNANGKEATACGNGSRCVAWLLSQELGRSTIVLETTSRQLIAECYPDNEVRVDIGQPSFHWADIPLLKEVDTSALAIQVENVSAPMAVSVGNPHMVFFVDNAHEVALRRIGPLLEHHHLFPQGANIGIAEVRDRHTLYLRVWERGAGLTEACGTGACAAVAAGLKCDLLEGPCRVIQEGGELIIEQDQKGIIHMRGPVALVFKGELSELLLNAEHLQSAA